MLFSVYFPFLYIEHPTFMTFDGFQFLMVSLDIDLLD